MLQALLAPFNSLNDVDIERYFNFACIWAFGGTLDLAARDYFSQWWRQTFDYSIDYPESATVSVTFHLVVHNLNLQDLHFMSSIMCCRMFPQSAVQQCHSRVYWGVFWASHLCGDI